MENKDKLINIIKGMKNMPEIDESIGLIDSGFFDSFDVINLITQIEQQFGTKIRGEDIIPENLNKCDDIVSLIERIKDD